MYAAPKGRSFTVTLAFLPSALAPAFMPSPLVTVRDVATYFGCSPQDLVAEYSKSILRWLHGNCEAV